MASKEGEAPPTEPVAPPAEPAAEPAAAPAEAAADAPPAEKPARAPLDPEAAAKRKAERAEKRKEQRKARQQAAKEARAAGEAKPKPAKAAKAELQVPEGAAPKISVAKLPADITVGELKALFEPHGTILRADVSKRRGRPTIGTIVYNTNNDVRRAFNALNGKHKCAGVNDPISIQYAKDSPALGETLKKTTDAVADCIREYGYKPAVLRSKDAKDFINRMVLARKKTPANDILTAALLVHAKAASVDELVSAKMIKSAGLVQQILSEKVESPTTKDVERSPKGKKEETKPAIKLEKTFDAVVPRLDKLEKERWNRMAKANLRLNERHRFRFVDILATPSLELWRWMVEDCEITPAEAGTCFAILQNYYGFTK